PPGCLYAGPDPAVLQLGSLSRHTQGGVCKGYVRRPALLSTACCGEGVVSARAGGHPLTVFVVDRIQQLCSWDIKHALLGAHSISSAPSSASASSSKRSSLKRLTRNGDDGIHRRTHHGHFFCRVPEKARCIQRARLSGAHADPRRVSRAHPLLLQGVPHALQ
ncbi:unnamed protein product, partial [Closterium sp. Naga37s-1]